MFSRESVSLRRGNESSFETGEEKTQHGNLVPKKTGLNWIMSSLPPVATVELEEDDG